EMTGTDASPEPSGHSPSRCGPSRVGAIECDGTTYASATYGSTTWSSTPVRASSGTNVAIHKATARCVVRPYIQAITAQEITTESRATPKNSDMIAMSSMWNNTPAICTSGGRMPTIRAVT